MKKIIIIFLVVLLAGCVAPVRHPTASGRPEITVPGKASDKVTAQITNRMINAGYMTRSASPPMLIFEKASTSGVDAALYGSRYNPTPAIRITYNIVEMPTETRIVANLAMITNPGSAHESATGMNNSPASQELQQFLNEIRIACQP